MFAHGFDPRPDAWGSCDVYYYRLECNSTFLDIFTTKIKEICRSTAETDPDYFAVAEFRRSVYSAAMRAVFCDFGSTQNGIMASIVYYLDLAAQGAVTEDMVIEDRRADIIYPEPQILTKSYDMSNGATYAVNKLFLSELVEMLETLELTDLQPGYAVIADRVRKLA